jgi:hypothetical protein
MTSDQDPDVPAWIDTAAAEERAAAAKREAGVFVSLYQNAAAWFDQIYENNHFRDRWADAKERDR